MRIYAINVSERKNMTFVKSTKSNNDATNAHQTRSSAVADRIFRYVT